MKSWIWTAAALALMTAAGVPGRAQDKPAGAKACFAKLKSLAGEWLQKDEKTGKETLLARYKLTASGSVVEETLFPGEPHEMVTMYHLDGDSLVLTHYCAGGNQPRLKALPTSTPDRMEFECVSVSNLKSHEDSHMHHAVIMPKSANHLTAEWTSIEKGKAGHVAKFDARRK
jgi:hypothetical protein